jgi:SWI/SNF-related matrix-associated actin-dependent regulator of chromatin subfamily B protein 1
MMKYSALDSKTDQPILQSSQPESNKNVQYVFLPRIRCRDCPGKLYTPGPEMTTVNFEVHLKNKNHRERVNTRVGRDTRPGGQSQGSGQGVGQMSQQTAMGSQSSQ